MPDPARIPPLPRPAALSPAARNGTAASADTAARAAPRRWLAGATDLLSGWMGLKPENGAMAGGSTPLARRHAAVATPQARALVQANDARVRQRVAARLLADCAGHTQVSGSVNALIHLSEEHATATLRREAASPWATRELTGGELDAIVEQAARFAQRLMSARNTDEMQHILESNDF
ncbi:MAG: hypothetical protein V4609_02370 [Pseudomonadota bacterium]